MKPPTDTTPWYIEKRSVSTPEKISLDLARHLPRRSTVGTVVVVTGRPTVILPVIRKRWVALIREVERQHSSTLDRLKKESLRQELVRLRHLTFAANTAYIAPPADIIFTTAEHMGTLTGYRTIYILDPLTSTQFENLRGHLLPNGLIVTYDNL
jgi:hypothetical protein